MYYTKNSHRDTSSTSGWFVRGCSAEARLCPDGSYVGRTGAACEFSPCTMPSARIHEIPPVDDTTSTEPSTEATSSHSGEVACPMDAKQCPDGSYVGRSGTQCEFSPCPKTNNESLVLVRGVVTISPTCPVERIPPDPACAPKPYRGHVLLTNTATGKSYLASTTIEGAFSTTLTRGVYDVSRQASDSPFPICSGKVEIVNPSVPIPISCDSGIR
jgi:hypothetical protein